MTNTPTIQDAPATMGPLATLCLAAALTVTLLAGTISAKSEAEPEATPQTVEQPTSCESQPRYCLACGGQHIPNAQDGLPCGN